MSGRRGNVNRRQQARLFLTEVDGRQVALPLDAPWHGTTNGYGNYRCRCVPCTTASTDAKFKQTLVRAARAAAGAPVPHGVNGYGNYRCRCEVCTTAVTEYRAARREKWSRDGDVPDRVHGSNNGYINYKCRCVRCRAAHAKYHQKDECVDDIWC